MLGQTMANQEHILQQQRTKGYEEAQEKMQAWGARQQPQMVPVQQKPQYSWEAKNMGTKISNKPLQYCRNKGEVSSVGNLTNLPLEGKSQSQPLGAMKVQDSVHFQQLVQLIDDG